MKYSIVTPLYNKELYIAETIESVLSQTYEDYEFVIVDDSSSDGSVEIVKSYKDSRIRLFTKPNGGVSSARNFGILKSEGDYICFLDADDIWHKTYLESLDNTIRNHPDAGFFCGAFECFRDKSNNVFKVSDLKTVRRNESRIVDFFEESYSKGGSIALTSTVSIRKSILMQLEVLFQEGISMGEDVDLWFRVASITKTVYNNTPLMLYRYVPEGGLTDIFKIKGGSYPYWKWYEHNNSPKARRFTTLMVYTSAKLYFSNGGYLECLDCLNKAEGKTMLFHRIVLRLRAIFLMINKR